MDGQKKGNALHLQRFLFIRIKESYLVTVQPSTVPRGAALHLRGSPGATRQTAVCADCTHAFVAMKPKD